MKQLWLSCVVLTCVLITTSTNLLAATFVDTLEDIDADGSIVSYRNVGGVGIDISVATDEPMRAFTYFESDPWAFGGLSGVKNAPLNPDNVSGARFISGSLVAGFEVNHPVIFDFSTPIQTFGLTVIGLLEAGSPATNYLSLVGFDASGNVVDLHTITGPQGDRGIDIDFMVSSALNEISQVQLTGDITYLSGYGIDDLILVTTDTIPPTSVTIDIKPSKKPENIISLKKDKNLKVAIVGSVDFDPLQVDPTTVKFGPAGTEASPVRSKGQDYNRDGFSDLILTFKLAETGIACGDTEATLTGQTLPTPVIAITGSDTFTVEPCP